MLIPNHPGDERLSAFAAGDPDQADEAALRAHVADCVTCSEVVADLRVLRSELADLPDIAPSRPLRLLPPEPDVEPSAADRAAGWMRRLFAPALTAGAALAMVGLVGTATPALDSMAGGGDSAEPGAVTFEGAPADGGEDAAAGEEERTSQFGAEDAAASPEIDALPEGAPRGAVTGTAAGEQLPAERSPWPMVLFSGIALVIGALLLRWILVPRAG